MTWTPCQRIVRADVPSAFRIRGIDPCRVLCWPNAALGSGADYSVDFSAVLCCEDLIREAAFLTTGGTVSWVSVFSGTLATVWITWTVPGAQSIEVTILTASGATITLDISILVRTEGALLNGDPPACPPNTLILSDGTVLETASGAQILTT